MYRDVFPDLPGNGKVASWAPSEDEDDFSNTAAAESAYAGAVPQDSGVGVSSAAPGLCQRPLCS